MGRVHDMVTGLLNGSSSMMPLFFKSRGVGFAVKKQFQIARSMKVILLAQTINNANLADAQLGKKKVRLSCLSL